MVHSIHQQHNTRGTSLVDVIVGTGIMAIVFMTLVASFTAALEFSARNRLRANALLLANEHLERIRALPYDTIGTVAGLPSGTIPQNETITYDGQDFTRRTFIQYIDDASDGLGAADTLAADYKRVKVELSYTYKGVLKSFALTTTVAPPSQESLSGAGVLQILVSDALNGPVSGATVHVVNTMVATSVDITTFTGASGIVSFPGAWAGDGYQVTVSKAGYSSAQTYPATVGNPSPSPGAANVLEAAVTELIFKIDRVSDVTVYTRELPTRERFLDTFADVGQLSALEDTTVVGGSLVLVGSAGSYASVGTGTSLAITPASLGGWLLLSFDSDVPVGTMVRYFIEHDTGGGVFAPVPVADLPGNDVGFTASPIDVGVLDPLTYTSLRVVGVLTSGDPNVTPEVHSWKVSYEAEDAPLAAFDFSLRGLKTIGTSPVVYKYDTVEQTDGVGQWQNTAMEWDEYAIAGLSPTHTLAEACPALPLNLQPDTTYNQVLTFGTASANALQVRVVDSFNTPVARAEVTVTGPGIDSTRATGACGSTYFAGLGVDTYAVTLEAAGFAPLVASVAVSGLTNVTLTVTP